MRLHSVAYFSTILAPLCHRLNFVFVSELHIFIRLMLSESIDQIGCDALATDEVSMWTDFDASIVVLFIRLNWEQRHIQPIIDILIYVN